MRITYREKNMVLINMHDSAAYGGPGWRTQLAGWQRKPTAKQSYIVYWVGTR